MLLEAIYEGSFENTSHGFRPKRSCHTALIQVQKNFTAAKWFIEGDIEGFFDNINHDVLIGILKERIADDRGKHGKIDPVGTDEIDPVKTA